MRCRLHWVIFLQYIVLYKCISGQSVSLTHNTESTECTKGLRAGLDFAVFNGTIDMQGLNTNEWIMDIPINLQEGSYPYTSFCSISLQSSACSPLNSLGCYCSSESGGVFTIIINQSAAVNLSDRKLRAQVIKSDYSIIKSAVVLVPTIYDIGNVQLVIKIDGIAADMKATNLTLSSSGNKLEFCCTNAPSPCLTMIKSATTTIGTSLSGCSEVFTSSNMNKSLTFTYSICGGALQSLTFDLVIVKPLSSEDNTGLVAGVVVGVGSCLLIAGIIIAVLIYKKEKPKCSDSKIILIIVVTVAGSIVIVGIVIGLLFYCNVRKSKKANKQPTGLTLAETTPPTNETSARHIETKKPLTPLAHLPPYKISPISGKNEKASNLTESNETPNDSTRKKKSKKKRARKKIENGGKNDEQ